MRQKLIQSISREARECIASKSGIKRGREGGKEGERKIESSPIQNKSEIKHKILGNNPTLRKVAKKSTVGR